MKSKFRTLLVLGRVSHLPTVWSNCLAGWWLGGGGNFVKLPLLLLGASALYAGGAFLNDAFDAQLDRQRRPTRPIPSGLITRESVWVWSFGLLALGALALAALGRTTGLLMLVLLVCIGIYDATHKILNLSPWLMGLCRFWVYVIASSTGVWGVNGGPIWCGLALAFYIAGLSHVARQEGVRGPVPYGALVLLVCPVLLAMLMNAGEARNAALLLSVVLVMWLAYCTRPLFQPAETNVGRVAANLLAGIVLVDWLAVGPLIPRPLSTITFLALFGAVKLLQRLGTEA